MAQTITYTKIGPDSYQKEVKIDADLNLEGMEDRKKNLQDEKAQITDTYNKQVAAIDQEIKDIDKAIASILTP